MTWITRDAVRERRNTTLTAPWHVIADRQTGEVFFAAHRVSGRSYRLPASSLAEAQAMVSMLNDTALEISA
jgi:hypothetical protein